MYKYCIQIVTMSDVAEFVSAAASIDGSVKLVDGDGFCVNGKSLLGAVASLEWDNLYCVSDSPIYEKINKFCK